MSAYDNHLLRYAGESNLRAGNVLGHDMRAGL